MEDQIKNNPNINTSQPTSDVMKKTGVMGIRNALVVLNLLRALGNTFGFLFILNPDLRNLGWISLLDSASHFGGWTALLDSTAHVVVLNMIIGTEFLLAIVAAMLFFRSLSNQRWGAAISIFTFALDISLWWRSGDTAIIAYLVDITVIMLAVIHFVKLKKPLFSESIPTLTSPKRDVAEPNPFHGSYRWDYRPKK